MVAAEMPGDELRICGWALFACKLYYTVPDRCAPFGGARIAARRSVGKSAGSGAQERGVETTTEESRQRWQEWANRIILIALLVANIWAQYLLWFGEQGIVRWQQTEAQLGEARERVAMMEVRLRKLNEAIMQLEKNPQALEEVARRDLGLVYPDEVLFVFPDVIRDP
ncbi:MAG: septum formation initiator family protein [Magnetococcales bacterium]|nr:septum formation initiator family protein [Magnetococcales bacterium]